MRGVGDDAARLAAAPFAAAFSDAAFFLDLGAPEVEVAADDFLDRDAVPPAAFLAAALALVLGAAFFEAAFFGAAFLGAAFFAVVLVAVDRFDELDFFRAAAIAVTPPGRT